MDTRDVALRILRNTNPRLEWMEVNHLAQVEFQMGWMSCISTIQSCLFGTRAGCHLPRYEGSL